MGKKAFDPQQSRTFALAGHRSTGKTSVAEMLLQATGVTRTIGSVDDQTSLLDHGPAARRRRMSTEPGFAWMPWRDGVLEMIDTPGSEGLSHHRRLALATVDAVVVVVGGSDGVEFGTERVLDEARASALPCIAVVNRADRLTDPAPVIAALERAAGVPALPVQVPFDDDEGRFAGVIELFGPDGAPRALRYDLSGSGRFSPEPVPERLAAEVSRARGRVEEAVALHDDALFEHYLEFLTLPAQTVQRALARLTRERAIVPVLYASAAYGMGAHPLLDALSDLVPSPTERRPPLAEEGGHAGPVRPDDPFLAQVVATTLDEDGAVVRIVRVWSGEPPRDGVWVNPTTGARFKVQKTYQIRGPRRAVAVTVGPGALLAVWDPLDGRPGATFGTPGNRRVMPVPAYDAPMSSWLVEPVGRRDKEGLPAALDKLRALDPAIGIERDPNTGWAVLAGQDATHLDQALDLLRRLGVHVTARLPPVPYKETPTSPVRRVRGVHKRYEGELVEEFGECWIDLVPGSPDDGVRFVNEAQPEQIPDWFVPSIGLGVRDATRHGPTAGYPVVGAGVRCVAGEYDILSSTDEHFRQAGARALEAALEATGTDLLEPWSLVRVEASPNDIGAVLQELGQRRSRIQDIEVGARIAVVLAHAPFKELRTFAPRLQAVTGGRGRFTATHDHYEKLPRDLVREAIDESPWRASGPDGSPSNAARNRPRLEEYNA